MKDLIKPLIVTALTWEAKMVLKRHKPFIIGVTGNLGKTSTKDAIYTVLKDHFHVRRSEKSMNSEFGVPLTILGEKSAWNNPFKWVFVLVRGFFVAFGKEYPTHLVLEIGADRPGDIKAITSWIKPDIVVVTQFGQVPVHVEFFKNREAVVEEKGYLVKALKKNGVFIWNADDHDSKITLIDKTDARKVSIGIEQHADIKADDITLYGNPLSGTKSKVVVGDTAYELVLPEVVGKSPVYCALPALAVAEELKISITDALQALCDGDKPKGRMRLLPGMNGSLIIDDTYNASPKATEHGLKTLVSIDTKGRKIAVLGDMMELGNHTREEHYRIGKVAGEIVHRLFTVGIRSRITAEGALDSKMSDQNIIQCDTSIEAGKELVKLLEPGDIVYLKGSQSIRMERAVKMILAATHPGEKYLVRQEKEWQNR
ncbi:MAG: UDP-N-acetylmuramoyl-tripeptide--D-alanyl-D-alanine ligase [Candidatus Pacebacteria bacterium]|nr:UDP-N-acetylmuramoyl-tripeptide--D-alanyl-D-alanine ligase [Candidatus Paceibacterota bacterium]